MLRSSARPPSSSASGRALRARASASLSSSDLRLSSPRPLLHLRVVGVRSRPPDRAAGAAARGLRPRCAPEPELQGRVPAGVPDDGYVCNARLVSHEGHAGGFKVERFVDKAGHQCAYYDTTLLFPVQSIQQLQDQSTGVAVVDMTDPEHPVRTETLATPAMQTPHESLVLSEKRGLLAAVMGNPGTAPGFVDVYDLNGDCRHPSFSPARPSASSATRAASPRTATRSTRPRSSAGRSRPRPDRPEAAPAARRLRLPVARLCAREGRQPPVRRRAEPGPDHARHQPDPGPRAEPADAGDQPPRLALSQRAADQHPGHDRRAAVPHRGRRVLGRRGRQLRGRRQRPARRRGAHHRHLGRDRRRSSSRTSGSR